MKVEESQRIGFAELRDSLESIWKEQRLPSSIRTLRRRLSGYSSSYTIENLSVVLMDGTGRQLVLKNLSPESVLQTARRVRPGFLYQPENEILTYQRILRFQRMGTPRCYGAVVRAAENRYWLFLERVNGPLLWQLAGGDAWNDAACWLARWQAAQSGGDLLTGSRGLHLRKYDEAFYQIWPPRAEGFVRQGRLAESPVDRRRFRELLRNYQSVIGHLRELPVTLIHGEYYPSNIIAIGEGARRRICPVDWEMAALGPGLFDLATLTAGNWSEGDRLGMVTAYRNALLAEGGRCPSLKAILRTLDFCQLHLSMQLLGWSANWQPPERHAQDWFRSALRLASRLGLVNP